MAIGDALLLESAHKNEMLIVIIVLKPNLNSDFMRSLNASSTASPHRAYHT